MRAHVIPAVLAAALAGPAAVDAHEPVRELPGSMVEVSVEVEGAASPLYAAPDGSGRFYFEARRGTRYAIRLANRTHQRLGVVLQVDGLNVISGERPSGWWGSDPGRMYVLDPWDQTEVKGWRTSLDEVRRFTFVDEERSYAARSGKANSKMGWVEVAVYREQGRHVGSYWPWRPDPSSRDRSSEGREEAAPMAESVPPASAPPTARAGTKRAPEGKTEGMADGGRAYPGTGWGQRANDHVVVVDFEPERNPAERITLRYEYASGLRALGIDLRPRWTRDRLRERDRGQDGFAKPPAW
jgi:hypothetical protein